ncbi:hypothetical protein GCM10022285_54210 [Streptomyces tunisiensis]|uniref:Uncharacterized protein n=1 Tax=Streptomyces tunisiensis TaxID=948699 RepID=A0ABP7Z4I1_9ACTN
MPLQPPPPADPRDGAAEASGVQGVQGVVADVTRPQHTHLSVDARMDPVATGSG